MATPVADIIAMVAAILWAKHFSERLLEFWLEELYTMLSRLPLIILRQPVIKR
jgi:hypothetical protein